MKFPGRVLILLLSSAPVFPCCSTSTTVLDGDSATSRRQKMSLSTNAISSDCLCPCSAGMSDVHLPAYRTMFIDLLPITIEATRHEGALEGWRKGLSKRFIPCKDSGTDFLSKYVPSRAPAPPPGDVSIAFAKFARWEPQDEESYPYLVRVPCFGSGLILILS